MKLRVTYILYLTGLQHSCINQICNSPACHVSFWTVQKWGPIKLVRFQNGTPNFEYWMPFQIPMANLTCVHHLNIGQVRYLDCDSSIEKIASDKSLNFFGIPTLEATYQCKPGLPTKTIWQPWRKQGNLYTGGRGTTACVYVNQLLYLSIWIDSKSIVWDSSCSIH